MKLVDRMLKAIHAFSEPVAESTASAPHTDVIVPFESEQKNALGLFEFKNNPVGDLIIPFFSNQEISPPEGYERLSIEGHKNSATVRAVISRVARRTAELPLKLQRHNKSTGKWADLDDTEDDEHPLMQLMQRPNPRQTKTDFFESVFAARFLAGESFILPNGPSPAMPPTELWWARPDKMRCIPNTDGTVQAWKYKVGRGEHTFDMKMKEGWICPVMQWKTFNPLDEWRGLSVLGSGKMQISQLNEGARWNANTLKNGMRPTGAFIYAPKDQMGRSLTSDQRKQLKQDIDDHISGGQNAGKPLILDGGLTWQEMSISPKDLEWLEGLRDAARVICFLMGYPPIMLGIPGDATYKNYNEARMSFYQDTAIPLMDSLLAELNVWLTPMYGDDLRLMIDQDQVEALSELRALIWDRAEKCSFLTPNEKRAMVGMDELEDPVYDELWGPTSIAPMTDTAKIGMSGLDENGDPIDPNADPNGDESQDSAKPGAKPAKPVAGKKPVKPVKKSVAPDEAYQAGLMRLQRLTERLPNLFAKKD